MNPESKKHFFFSFLNPVDSLLPLNLLILLTKWFPTGVKPEDKPLEWIHLHHKGHKMLTAYLTFLAQLVNQGRT